MSTEMERHGRQVYKLALTGGPCGGKTTGQARLCTFFENLGWKVYRVPEMATYLMCGGIKWQDLSESEVYKFQEDLLKSMIQLENTFNDLTASASQNCLIICDRGTMDATAYMHRDQWERMKVENDWNEVELRDTRYNQVIHMVSAAHGAEDFYRSGAANHVARYEGLELARHLDSITSQAWVGHPYFDIIDNSTDFERKVQRMISAVCNRLGIEVHDRLSVDSRKRKFLINKKPDDSVWGQFEDFAVVHDYLITPHNRLHQARIRKRGQNGHYTYTHTIRRPEINHECPELRIQISRREYEKDCDHQTVYKRRRCFVWNNQYFQMDIFEDSCSPRCRGLIILETFTTLHGSDLALPLFLDINREVTDDPNYSLFNLSLREEQQQMPLPPLPHLHRHSADPPAITHVNGVTPIHVEATVHQRHDVTSDAVNGFSHD